jgi:hypothetical protein
MVFLSAEGDHNLIEGARSPEERETRHKAKVTKRKAEIVRKNAKKG